MKFHWTLGGPGHTDSHCCTCVDMYDVRDGPWVVYGGFDSHCTFMKRDVGFIFRFQISGWEGRLFLHAEVVLSCTVILSTVGEIQPAEIWRRAGLFTKQCLVYPEPGLPPSRVSIRVTGQIYRIVLHGSSTKLENEILELSKPLWDSVVKILF